MIFFYDFVTPQKRNISEGCLLFTLKMAVRSLGNRDFTFRWFQPNVITGKNTNLQYLGLEAKIEINKGTLFSATSKSWENKVVLLFSSLAFRHIVFLRGGKIIKENHKKHRLRDSFKFCCPTLAANKTRYRSFEKYDKCLEYFPCV